MTKSLEIVRSSSNGRIIALYVLDSEGQRVVELPYVTRVTTEDAADAPREVVIRMLGIRVKHTESPDA